MWLGVPHVDQGGDAINTQQLELARVNRKLADAVLALPATGEFEHAILPLGTFCGQAMQYRYAPNPMDLTERFLELRSFLRAAGARGRVG